MLHCLHGLASGTDSLLPWAQALYWFFGGSVLFLTVVRIVAGLIEPKPALAARACQLQHAGIGNTPGKTGFICNEKDGRLTVLFVVKLRRCRRI